MHDEHWGFKLLKRKDTLRRELLLEVRESKAETAGEYHNFFELRDTSFGHINPVMVEVDFECIDVPVPLNAWLVLQIDGNREQDNQFVRTPLNLVKYNWSGQRAQQTLVSGNIPLQVKRIVAYLWNIDKMPLKISIRSVRLYRLLGKGITEISKAKI
ncbi:MAG TPA: hypothetical protein VEB42_14815 [Chitinophagaceae bacterium]|nr:hypothetical protein [Chitinophagaceae bacterium]